jgi:hypothetical protein
VNKYVGSLEATEDAIGFSPNKDGFGFDSLGAAGPANDLS